MRNSWFNEQMETHNKSQKAKACPLMQIDTKANNGTNGNQCTKAIRGNITHIELYIRRQWKPFIEYSLCSDVVSFSVRRLGYNLFMSK